IDTDDVKKQIKQDKDGNTRGPFGDREGFIYAEINLIYLDYAYEHAASRTSLRRPFFEIAVTNDTWNRACQIDGEVDKWSDNHIGSLKKGTPNQRWFYMGSDVRPIVTYGTAEHFTSRDHKRVESNTVTWTWFVPAFNPHFAFYEPES